MLNVLPFSYAFSHRADQRPNRMSNLWLSQEGRFRRDQGNSFHIIFRRTNEASAQTTQQHQQDFLLRFQPFMTIRSVISVMVPTYEPDELLVQAIRSVLAEARRDTRASFTINVTVVDDASPSVDVAAIVAQADPEGRVELVQNDCQLGLAGNWNRAISLAKGD